MPLIVGALGNISDEDLPIALRLLAASGNFDGDGETSEAKNLIEFGRGLGGEALSPAARGHRAQRAVRQAARPVHHHLPAIAAAPLRAGQPGCLVDGRKPTDIFLETDATARRRG